jgi:hypothetical protein
VTPLFSGLPPEFIPAKAGAGVTEWWLFSAKGEGLKSPLDRGIFGQGLECTGCSTYFTSVMFNEIERCGMDIPGGFLRVAFLCSASFLDSRTQQEVQVWILI